MGGRSAYLLYGVLAVVFCVWLVGRLGGEERRIERRLEGLAEILEKDGAESGLVAVNKARQVGGLFADKLELHLEPFAGTITDRRQISQAMVKYRSSRERLSVSFSDIEIELDDAGRNGDMNTVATVSDSQGRQRFRLAFTWVKEDGDWRIRRLRLVEVLESGGLF